MKPDELAPPVYNTCADPDEYNTIKILMRLASAMCLQSYEITQATNLAHLNNEFIHSSFIGKLAAF
jgi:hypothetical protein